MTAQNRKMKILLINPIDREFMPPSIFPLGLGYIAAVLKKAGHFVRILDLNGHRLLNSVIVSELNKQKFDLVGISGMITQYKKIKEITRTVRKIDPNVPVILGGSGPTSTPEIFLKYIDCDLVCLGEGEKTTIDIIDYLKGIIPIEKCDGIAFKKNGKLIYTQKRKQIKNLDSIPFPAWELFDAMETYINNFLFRFESPNGMNVMASRGCPGHCSYCLCNFGHRVRVRSAENILDEIKLLIENYGIRHIHFLDDTFGVFRKQAKELCTHMIKEKLGITWSANCRVNLVDRGILDLMAKSGCVFVAYGIESASSKILKEMKKGFNKIHAENAIKWAREVGINCRAYFMIGMPSEDRESIWETVEFCKKNLVGGEFFFTTPFPKTELYQWSRERNLIRNEDIYFETACEVRDFVINLTQLENEELFELKETAEKEIQEHLKKHGIEVKVGIRKDPRDAVKSLPKF